MLSHSQFSRALSLVVLEWKIVMLDWTMNAVCDPGRPTQATVMLPKRTSDSGIFEGFSWSV